MPPPSPPDHRPERPRFLAASRGVGLEPETLAELAAWLDLAPWPGRPLPEDSPGLVLTALGARLLVPGGGAGYWPAGLVDRRTERGEEDALVRAVAPRVGDTILDGTFGLGHDALVLARRGARIHALERDPALLFYSAQGLARHDPAAARRLTLRCTDHREFLRAQPDATYDVVYLDPMFPAGRHRRGPTLEPLRRCALPDPVTSPTLHHGFRVARRALVLRLPPDGDPPTIAGLPTPTHTTSRRVGFATWHHEAVPSAGSR